MPDPVKPGSRCWGRNPHRVLRGVSPADFHPKYPPPAILSRNLGPASQHVRLPDHAKFDTDFGLVTWRRMPKESVDRSPQCAWFRPVQLWPPIPEATFQRRKEIHHALELSRGRPIPHERPPGFDACGENL